MEDKTLSGRSTAVETAENNSGPAKKMSKAKAVKSQRSKTMHPPTSEMVNAAIKDLKDRKGSSLQAIKKYIATTYKVDGEKLAPFIKRYLKAAITSGAVVQTKGKGASGSFKLSASKSSESKTKVQKSVKATESKKTNKSVEKKTTPVRKSVTSKKPGPAKQTEVAKKSAVTKKTSVKVEKAEKTKKPVIETKIMSKSKRTAKAPAAKTRTPRPKKAATFKS